MPGAEGVPVLVLQVGKTARQGRGRSGGTGSKAEVARLFAEHAGKYGSPRITADLRDAGRRGE
jgi:hypothetical protein